MRPLWFVKLLKKAFPSIKYLARLTRIPILTKIFELLLFREDEIIYLPKDQVIPINMEVSKPEDMVLPSRVLEYFIKKAKHHWIMDFCICRASMECEDYPINLGCLFLGDGVLEINPRLGKQVSKEEALNHLEKCKEAGLVHLIGRNRLDKQWLGVKQGTKLLTICNCCPCCCLWRISPILSPKLGSNVKRMEGIEIKVTDKCIACGECTHGVCFVDAIKIVNNKAQINDECRGCGRCVEICPQDAIELKVNNLKESVQVSINQINSIIEL
ncbi:MAG: Electron transport complex subunit RsxB [Promethearchaeota archaeon]|nr:MAG: Electron transport complex subunit RsxB [Candidatus Lokiarchaeota archaeon]